MPDPRLPAPPTLPAFAQPRRGFDFRKIGTARWDWRDSYHGLLTLSWPWFCACLLGAYLVLNVGFAALYYAASDSVDGMTAGSFASAFFFSVETLATVGYGHMYPATVYGHMVVTVEIVVGMFGTAVMTGLIFVRFSRPTGRLVFSRVLVLGTYDGQPALMLRVANERRQAMVRAEFRLACIRREPTLEDPALFRFRDLPLQANHMIFFPAAVTIRHLIDASSPLYGVTAESLRMSGTRFMASIECVDKTLQAPVQNEILYEWDDVRFGERFVEIYSDDETGPRQVDYGRLHDTEPLPATD